MKLRTNKQGTLIATVDGIDHDICAKGEHNRESVEKMCDTLLSLVQRDEAIVHAKEQLEAARQGHLPEPTEAAPEF